MAAKCTACQNGARISKKSKPCTDLRTLLDIVKPICNQLPSTLHGQLLSIPTFFPWKIRILHAYMQPLICLFIINIYMFGEGLVMRTKLGARPWLSDWEVTGLNPITGMNKQFFMDERNVNSFPCLKYICIASTKKSSTCVYFLL